MKSRRLIFNFVIIALLTYGVLSASVGETAASMEPNISTSVTTSTPAFALAESKPLQSREESLRREAQQFAQNYWRRILTKCGDSYYWKHQQSVYDPTYFEARGGPSIVLFRGSYVPPKKLTRAEELNNEDPQPVEFAGVVRLNFEAFRSDKAWSALANRTWHEGMQLDTFIYKKKGKWVTGAGDDDPLKPVRCGEITADRQERRGIDLSYYCTRKFGSSAIETFTPGDASSWQCKNDEGYFKVDMDQACEWKYGGSFKATYDDRNDPKSWHCILKNATGQSNVPVRNAESTSTGSFVGKMVKDYEVWGGGRGREWEVTVPKNGGWVSTGIPVSVNQDIFILSSLLSATPTFSILLGTQIIPAEFNETTQQGWVLHASLREPRSGGGKGRLGVPSSWNDVIRIRVEGGQVQATALNVRIEVSDVAPNRREGDKTLPLPMLGGPKTPSETTINTKPRLKLAPNIRVANEDRYSIRLFNCDDGCKALIGNDVVVQTGFGEDSGWIDVTDKISTKSGRVKFQVINESQAIAYGFQVKKNDSIVFERICGKSRVVGCENNRNFSAGIARDFAFDLLPQ